MDTNTTEQFCQGCPNACPLDTLSCDKGRALNGITIVDKENKETLLEKIIRCGNRCSELSDQLLDYGVEPDMLLTCLNADMQAQLSTILDNLDTYWSNNF